MTLSAFEASPPSTFADDNFCQWFTHSGVTTPKGDHV